MTSAALGPSGLATKSCHTSGGQREISGSLLMWIYYR